MEFIRLTSETAKKLAKGSTKEQGKVTLPKGRYKVLGFTQEKADISGKVNEWLNIHLQGVGHSAAGSMSFSRLLNGGISEKPVLGRTKQKWYYPTLSIGCVYEGDASDFAMALDGGDVIIDLEVKDGKNPNFTLSSWDTEEEAIAGAAEGFSEKRFYRTTKIEKVVAN